MHQTLTELVSALRAAEDILLICHVSPDGDTCGSALALRRALVSGGKRVCVACEHPLPSLYLDLDGAQTVCTPDALAGKTFDLAVAVDVSGLDRFGACEALFNAARDCAQIDHHATNPGFARINYIRSPLSATGVLAAEVVDALGVALDEPLAKCLFVAISTDTGNFRQRNTDADALRLAARCVEAGVDVAEITRHLFDLKPLAQTRLTGRALESLQTICDGQVALMRLSKADFDDCGALPEHTEGLINYAINTSGVQVACLLSQKGERIKGSMRSLPPCDVARIAALLGGGGHARAAGFQLDMSLDDACARVAALMAEELERHG